MFERQNIESLQSSLYEWYVGYEDIKEILQTEIKGPTKHNLVDGNVSILVAGCGNSSLCEDLSRDGIDFLFLLVLDAHFITCNNI